ELTQRFPQILPGGKAVLFTSSSSSTAFDDANIDLVSLTDGHRTTLQRGGTYGRYFRAATGEDFLLYVRQGTLFAVPFNLDRLETHGTPIPVLEDVSYNPAGGQAQLDFSSSGTLIYRNGGASGASFVTVQWLDSSGRLQPLQAKPGSYFHPALSPDGSRLAMSVTDVSGQDIWIYESQRGTMTRLTTGLAATYPLWTPDGR